MDKFFTRVAGYIAVKAGSANAFVFACLIILVWVTTGPIFNYSDTWQLIINTGTTIVTFLMVFLIQNSQNRDSTAIEAKLDELIRAIEGARSGFIGIEHLTENEVEEIRKAIEEEIMENPDIPKKSKLDVETILQKAAKRSKGR